MHKQNDWRRTNQDSYLKDVTLVWRPYSPSNPNNDHDHCEFCGAKFMSSSQLDTLREGYSTQDGYRWICKECFDDFVDLFEWEVVAFK